MSAKPISVEDLHHILSETELLWEEMRGQRIFISGGTGFFGCWLLESFLHIDRELPGLRARAIVLDAKPGGAARAPAPRE